MTAELQSMGDLEIHIENVGGIDELDTSFEPGVTVLEGRNATNRSSLLQGLMAACGSDNVSVKGDAEEANVELTIGTETYTRRLVRSNGSIQTSGEPYLEESTLADLFAFLVETNEARNAVAHGGDLRELIMRPVDTDAIEADIARLVRKRDDIESELREIETLERELPDLESDRSRLEEEIEDIRSAIESTQGALEEANAAVEAEREDQFQDKFEELQELRSDLDRVRYELETERESLEALGEEATELEEELDDQPEGHTSRADELDDGIASLRERKQSIEAEVGDLQSIVRFNEEQLDERPNGLLSSTNDDGGSVTDKLVDPERTTCWTCGTDVETEQIRNTVDTLRGLYEDKLDRIEEIQNELDDLTARRRTFEERERRREQLQQRLEGISTQIGDREASIGRLEERRDELEAQVATIEAEVEALEDDSYDQVLELQKELNQLEHHLGGLERDHERVDDEIDSIEARVDEREVLEAEHDELEVEIHSLRTRIEDMADTAVEQFNEHMANVLELLEYDNLERIWLEQVGRDGDRPSQGAFELHVIRSTSSGTTYEDTVAHLSESERTVTGLVFALAGYLVHDVYEVVPLLLLDSLEVIDASRIARLVDYFSEYSVFLIAALLPEDATAVDEGYARLSLA